MKQYTKKDYEKALNIAGWTIATGNIPSCFDINCPRLEGGKCPIVYAINRDSQCKKHYATYFLTLAKGEK